MSEHYDFHYQPTGSGAISGQQVLEQTEDAINELGDYVNDNVGGAMDVAQQALETAQNAETNAQTALDTANSFSGAIQSAQQDASTALSTAQTAQTTASNANNTAIQASQDASSAVTTANNASGQVSTLSGTVTALGQRVTTAEGNIGQNTSDITALTTRVGTAEGNITTLQNDVTIAQGNASSAMATAGTVKQQAYVFRYSSTALTPSSTNSNTLLDNTDNLKVGDKVIDSNGVLFSITAIDTQNSTFTIGTALVDLAQDSDVVHKSGNETINGVKTITDTNLEFKSTSAEYGVSAGDSSVIFKDKNNLQTFKIYSRVFFSGVDNNLISFFITQKVDNTYYTSNGIQLYTNTGNKDVILRPILANNNADGLSVSLGASDRRWSKIYGAEYYYGSNNVEFSTKFVTTDTNQTISGAKTFNSDTKIYNASASVQTDVPNLVFKNSLMERASTTLEGEQTILFTDKNDKNIGSIQAKTYTSGTSDIILTSYSETSDQSVRTTGIVIRRTPTTSKFHGYSDSVTSLGDTNRRWSKVYAMSYYYGNDNIEFSTKFVTTDTNQTISGNKTFSSINGVEPSSLSLPDINNRIDISSYITNLSNIGNEYTPSVNGWICIRSGNATKISVLDVATSIGNASISNTATYLTVMTPVIANRKVYISVICTSLEHAYFIPCQGNV